MPLERHRNAYKAFLMSRWYECMQVLKSPQTLSMILEIFYDFWLFLFK